MVENCPVIFGEKRVQFASPSLIRLQNLADWRLSGGDAWRMVLDGAKPLHAAILAGQTV